MNMIKIAAQDIKPGQQVDLEGCKYVPVTEYPSVEFELAQVTDVEQETDACTVISFEGLDAFGFPSDYMLDVKLEI